MVEVKPFKGITYNTKRFTNFENLTSPPYDIISKNMQDQLYEESKYNFVRLIFGKKKMKMIYYTIVIQGLMNF